jgi:hypothetical protein
MNRNALLIENASIYLFFATVVIFGYFLEINFVKMGESVLSQPAITVEVEVKKMGWAKFRQGLP